MRSTGGPLLVELKASSLASLGEDENFLAALQHSTTVLDYLVFCWDLVEKGTLPKGFGAKKAPLPLAVIELCWYCSCIVVNTALELDFF